MTYSGRKTPSCRLHKVVDDAGEYAGCLGGVELGDFVSPPFTANLFERRFEPAGYEFLVEAWGAGWGQFSLPP